MRRTEVRSRQTLEPERKANWLDRQVQSNLLIAVLISASFALVVLFRSETFDNDFLNYEAVYIGYLDFGFEIGFDYLLYIGRELGVPISAWLAIISFPGLLIKFTMAARKDGAELAVFTLLFVSSFFLLHELNQARFALAVAFAAVAAWLRKKHAMLAIMVILCGSLFHYGVLILLPALMGLAFAVAFFAILAVVQYFIQMSGIGVDFLLSFLPAFLSDSARVRGYSIEAITTRGTVIFASLSMLFYLFQITVAYFFQKIYIKEDEMDSLFIVARRTSFFAIPVFIIFVMSPVLANRFAEAHRFFLLYYLSAVLAKVLKGRGIDPLLAALFLLVVVLGNLYVYGSSVLPLHQALEQVGLTRPITSK